MGGGGVGAEGLEGQKAGEERGSLGGRRVRTEGLGGQKTGGRGLRGGQRDRGQGGKS